MLCASYLLTAHKQTQTFLPCATYRIFKGVSEQHQENMQHPMRHTLATKTCIQIHRNSSRTQPQHSKKMQLQCQTIIDSKSGTTMDYGSEFRLVKQLEPLLKLHQDWPYFKKQLEKGSKYPIRQIKETKKKKWVKHILKFGNHTLAEDYAEMANELTKNTSRKVSPFPWQKQQQHI